MQKILLTLCLTVLGFQMGYYVYSGINNTSYEDVLPDPDRVSHFEFEKHEKENSILNKSKKENQYFEKLPRAYQITFGEKSAPIEITQFYSLSCPHCVQIFNNDFRQIREEYIENGKLRYVFHPVPMDLTTVQFMCCLEELDEDKKRLLLSVLLEELSLENPDFNVILMKKAMEVLENPLDDLDDEEFIKSTKGFKYASDFVMQEETLKTIPSIQIGNKVIEKVPDYTFISLIMNRLYISESDYEY